MFVSVPEHEFTVPVQLGPAKAKYWRALGLSVGTAWFVLTVRSRFEEQIQTTMLFVWDTDVVNALEKADSDLESLLCVLPAADDAIAGLTCVAIKEVWEAVDRESPDQRCILFVDFDGIRRAGMFLEPKNNALRTSLIAKIPG